MHASRSKTPRIDVLEATVVRQQQVIDVLTGRLNRLEQRVHEIDHKGVSGAMGFV
ncbi:MAG: hypothetical protein KGI38_00520 [Thaumarchaeota archaeon]|nr:hypothetical protein [Nitrososphaerota archaeon]